MRIVYSRDPFDEIEISATEVEWIAFSEAIMWDGMTIDCDDVLQPAPYARVVKRLVVSHRWNEKVAFSFETDEILLLRGDQENLAVLAKNALNIGTNLAPGMHVHVEYLNDTGVIGSDSVPAVFARL